MGTAFVFPGQGSQAPGMGQEVLDAFPVARHVLEEVDEALKQKLSKLIAEGPAERFFWMTAQYDGTSYPSAELGNEADVSPRWQGP